MVPTGPRPQAATSVARRPVTFSKPMTQPNAAPQATMMMSWPENATLPRRISGNCDSLQRAVDDEADDQRIGGRHARRLGRRHEPAQDAAEDDDRHADGEGGARLPARPTAPSDRSAGTGLSLSRRAMKATRDHLRHADQNPRYHRGGKQPADRGVGDRAVDDDRQGRRDGRADDRGRGDDRGGERRRITGLGHGRNEDAPQAPRSRRAPRR